MKLQPVVPVVTLELTQTHRNRVNRCGCFTLLILMTFTQCWCESTPCPALGETRLFFNSFSNSPLFCLLGEMTFSKSADQKIPMTVRGRGSDFKTMCVFHNVFEQDRHAFFQSFCGTYNIVIHVARGLCRGGYQETIRSD